MPLNFPSMSVMNDVATLRTTLFAGLEREKAEHERFMANPHPTIDDLDHDHEASKAFGDLWGYLDHVNNMEYRQEWQDLLQELQTASSEYFGPIGLDKTYLAKKQYLLDHESRLSPYERRGFQKAIDDFDQNGGNLSQKKKDKLVAYGTQMQELQNTFSANLQKYQQSQSVDLTLKDLKGVPESVVVSLKKYAEKAGVDGYRVPAQYGLMSAVLEYADKESTRKKIYKLLDNMGQHKDFNNLPVANALIKLRRKSAGLLGQQTIADRKLQDRMAKKGDTVVDFLTNLLNSAHPMAKQDYREREAFAKERKVDYSKRWNNAYINRLYKEAKFSIDHEAIRQYFPLEKVHSALFAWVKEFYNVDILPYVPEGSLWHEDAVAWEWRDGDRILGYTTEDLFERQGKTDGAYHSGYQSFCHDRIGVELPEAHIVANFRKDADGVYLELDEIETLWHEYGHALHHMLTEVPSPSYNGTSVARDAVELPSQLMENFMWDKTRLQSMSAHKVTGEPLSDELYDHIMQERQDGKGTWLLSQGRAGLFDMLMHHTDVKTVEQAWQYVVKTYAVTDHDNKVSYRFPGSFSHIFAGGYASGYYGYLWAEVLSADVYQKVKNSDNPVTVMQEFRAKILSQGWERDMDELFRDFMGRDPDPSVLLRHYGIAV